jgi:hypothetical protein
MTHAPPPNRWHRAAEFIVWHLPPLLVRDTERVVLNLATGTVGITSLLALREPGTIADALSIPLLILWSVTLIIGAILVIVGMSRGFRVVERAGLMLTALGCTTYALALFGSESTRAKIVGVLFLAIAAAKVVRLLVSWVIGSTVTQPEGDTQ